MKIAGKYSVDMFSPPSIQRLLKTGVLLFSVLTVSACGSSEPDSVEVASDSLASTTQEQVSAVVDTETLDDYFDALEEQQRWLGSVALIVNGEVVYQRSIQKSGLDKVEQTIHRIGSITKSYTSTVIMQLVQANKLALTDTLDRWYPGIANASKITVRDLLLHRAGLENFTDRKDYFTYNTAKQDSAGRLAQLESLAVEFAPGEQQKYSNTSYLLLGMIAERVSGKGFSQLVQQRITGPLELSSTVYPLVNEAEVLPAWQEANSYLWQGEWRPSPSTHATVVGSAGAMLSTPIEVAGYFRSLIKGEVLEQNALETVLPAPGEYGAGINTLPYGARQGFGHGGKIDGHGSLAGYFPDGDVAFAVFSNGTRMNTNDVAIAVLATAYGDSLDIPEFAEPSSEEVPVELIANLAGHYISANMPLDIDLFVEGDQLFGQATGQGKFPLTASTKNTFEYAAAGIVVEITGEGRFTLHQGGSSIPFERQAQ